MQHFSNKTLNENWYELRLAREQTYQKHPEKKLRRDAEPDINCLTSSGIPAPLGRFHRKPKQETDHLICDDGFRELKTTNQQEIQKPKAHMRKEKPVLSMINKYNIAELSLVDRPIQTTNAGFGAVIPRHDQTEGARYFRSENRDNFGEKQPADPRQTVADYKKQSAIQGGTNARAFENQGTHQISNLVGELYSKRYDPQEQTDVQRSWLYQQDPGVRAVNEGKSGKGQMQFFDNANSLCLGEGIHATKKFDDSVGAFRRVRQDVTITANQTITRK